MSGHFEKQNPLLVLNSPWHKLKDFCRPLTHPLIPGVKIIEAQVRQYEGLFLGDVSHNDYSRVLNSLPLIVKLFPPFAPDKQQGKR